MVLAVFHSFQLSRKGYVWDGGRIRNLHCCILAPRIRTGYFAQISISFNLFLYSDNIFVSKKNVFIFLTSLSEGVWSGPSSIMVFTVFLKLDIDQLQLI